MKQKLGNKTNGADGVETQALVTGAAEKLAAFVVACERELTAEVVNGYLCDGFAELCRALNGLRMENSDLETLAVAKQMEDSLMALDGCVVRMFGRLGREPQRSFRRAAQIVGSVFKPGAFSADKMPSVWKGKVTPETYRQMVIDRACEAIRDPLVWLRDESRALEME